VLLLVVGGVAAPLCARSWRLPVLGGAGGVIAVSRWKLKLPPVSINSVLGSGIGGEAPTVCCPTRSVPATTDPTSVLTPVPPISRSVAPQLVSGLQLVAQPLNKSLRNNGDHHLRRPSNIRLFSLPTLAHLLTPFCLELTLSFYFFLFLLQWGAHLLTLRK
jgi:hypothetical protein